MKQVTWMLLAVLLALAALAASAAGPEYASHGMPGASPTEVYLQYAQVIHAADSAEAIIPYSPQPLEQVRASMASMTSEQMGQALAFLRSMVPVRPEVLAETVEGDTATLRVRGELPGLIGGEASMHVGTVTLVRRGGEWKVSDQSFEEAG